MENTDTAIRKEEESGGAIALPTSPMLNPCSCPQPQQLGVLSTDILLGIYHGQPTYKKWLDEGGDINAMHAMGYTFVFMVCAGGHSLILQDLLEIQNLHLNLINRWGMTPLMGAVKWGHDECARLLLTTKHSCQLDLTVKDKEGLTALSLAAREKRWNIIPLLLKPHVRYDADTIDFTLYRVVDGGLWEVVTTLLEEHDNLSQEAITRVLFRATRENNVQVVRIIVEKHIHLCRYEDLVTARILAEDYKYMDIERLLLGARTRSLDFLLNLSMSMGLPPEMSLPVTQTWDSRIILDTPPAHMPLNILPPVNQDGLLTLNVRPVKTPVPPGPDVYDTTATPRGLVLILNYNRFHNQPHMTREGSHADIANLKNLCSQMGYEELVHCDLTKRQTIAALTRFRNQERLKSVGCALVAIMSHGIGTHTFYSSDMESISVNEVQNLFLDQQCPNLRNKPKIFLFNFCRGINIPAPMETDAVREPPRNMICLYSTTESFLSYRDKVRGCPFIIAICEVLANHAHEMDLDNLIRVFQGKYLANATPEIQNLGFYKRFFFNPIGRR
ncbi:uncharacterized protein LOC119579510 isoform X1 [Penaeus monodon]|uniref:uncharacterized protein LOC119579510 isoform X1 n=2 Tax=Penaeus monodon TaxID=6687 RepID=UPI0018A72F34|nr:uncharacterized protein LOC119579510 isoform X1 [Penaeus monodon]